MPESDDHPKIPTVVQSRPLPEFEYDSLSKGDRIGTGGDADVYHATIEFNSEVYPVAVKEPRFEGTLHQQVLERFENEAETWAKLDDHNNIVTVYSCWATPLPWLALEYMDAGTLAEKIGTIDIPEALWLSGRIAEGIRYGHRHGIAHLDIKPSNILLRETDADTWDYPKVSDWGLAKLLLEHSKSMEGLSPTYAAPEQFATDEFGRPDDITDIYQLGTVIYALVAGKPPFSGSATAVMQGVLQDEPEPPSNKNPAVPPAVDEILLKSLAKQKAERYQGVLPFLQDINKVFTDYVSGNDNSGTALSESESSTLSVHGTDSDTHGETVSEKNSTQSLGSLDQSNEETTASSSLTLGRRAVLGSLGLGTAGAGFFALSRVRDNTTDGPDTPTPNPDTPTPNPDTPTPNPDTPTPSEDVNEERFEPQLSKRWSAEPGADYIWTDGSSFYFHDHSGSARAEQSHINWSGEKNIDGGKYHLPSETFGYYEDTVVFGFFADIGKDPPYSEAGAHFYAYNRESGEERWTLSAPDDGKHRRAVAATVTEGIAAVGCDDWAKSNPIVYVVDAEFGEEIWQNTYSDMQLNTIVSYNGRLFLCFGSGIKVVDPNTGTEIETIRSIRTNHSIVMRNDAIVSGNSLFTIDENIIISYRLDERSTQWRADPIEDIRTSITLDNSLLVVGSGDGSVYAIDRASGTTLWKGSVVGEVVRIALTSYNIWVRNNQGGVFALNRDSGEIVHQSKHGTDGGIGIVNDIALIANGDSVEGHWIE